jgi:glycosyltransferase involved in cell wall biosynthesis
MKCTVWCVCRDEEFYIDMMLNSVIDYADGIYILDTGSKDGTLGIIEDFQKRYPGKIILEQKDFGEKKVGVGTDGKVYSWSLFHQIPGFYQEKEARNYALDRVEKIFNPDWLIQLDSDEIYNERFWEIFKVVKESPITNTFGFSTLVPITPYIVSNNPHCLITWKGNELYDPHVRVWKTNLNVRWEMPIGRHVIPRIVGTNQDLHCDFASSDQIHFHLHRSFGPKSIHAWMTKFIGNWVQASETLNIPVESIFDQKYYEEHFPDWFKNGKFNPPKQLHEFRVRAWGVKPLKFTLPDFVIKKWENWGGCFKIGVEDANKSGV